MSRDPASTGLTPRRARRLMRPRRPAVVRGHGLPESPASVPSTPRRIRRAAAGDLADRAAPFTGVDLLALGHDQPRRRCSGLSLDFDDRGVTLTKAGWTTVWSRPWDGLVDLPRRQSASTLARRRHTAWCWSSPPVRSLHNGSSLPARRPGADRVEAYSFGAAVDGSGSRRSGSLLAGAGGRGAVLLVAAAVAVLLLSAGPRRPRSATASARSARRSLP